MKIRSTRMALEIHNRRKTTALMGSSHQEIIKGRRGLFRLAECGRKSTAPIASDLRERLTATAFRNTAALADRAATQCSP